MPRLEGSPRGWRDAVRRIEALGFDTVSISDHFTRGWVMEPTAAMLAATEATERLRVLSLVLGNDYRHPVLLHKTAATMDVLSEGRVELGLGAGWLRSDYDAAGLPYDEPRVRLERLEESVRVLKGLFGPEPLTFHGAHYRITELDGLPKPVQTPHPPVLVGGGGKRVLGIAAREANIVGVHCNLRRGELDESAAADLAAERVAEKVGWVRAAAGERFDRIELAALLWRAVITDDIEGAVAAVASARNLAPEQVRASPYFVFGPVSKVSEDLLALRERFGVSYVSVFPQDAEAFAPVVARLAGT
jgi:probable F420-dependent oxidoreductase